MVISLFQCKFKPIVLSKFNMTVAFRLPLNSSCAWVTPAAFKPELVPEELMANSLALTVEDYVSAMQRLVNDYRFTMYLILYKRVLFVWIALGFILLLSLLFSGVRGLPLFAGGLVWLIMNALGIFVCMWFKFKVGRSVELAKKLRRS